MLRSVNEFIILVFNPLFSDARCRLAFQVKLPTKSSQEHGGINVCPTPVRWQIDNKQKYVDFMSDDENGRLSEIDTLLSELKSKDSITDEEIDKIGDKISDVFRTTAISK